MEVPCTLWPFRVQDTDSRWKWLEAVGQGPHWHRRLFLQPPHYPTAQGKQRLPSSEAATVKSWLRLWSWQQDYKVQAIQAIFWNCFEEQCVLSQKYSDSVTRDSIVYLWGMPNLFEYFLFFYICLLLGTQSRSVVIAEQLIFKRYRSNFLYSLGIRPIILVLL